MAAPWDEKYEKAPAAAAPVKSAPPPEATPVITAPVPSTPAALWESRKSAGKTPVQVVTGNMGEAGNAVVDAGKNAIQDSLAYARQFASDNPEVTGALTAIPLAYIANKVAEKTGLYDTLANKIKSDSGPVPTTSNKAQPSTPDVNNTWDIHNKPASVANEEPWYSKTAGPQPWEKQAGSYWNWYDKQFPENKAAPVSTEAPAPSQNLTLEEAKARMAGIAPAPAAPAPVAPVVPDTVAMVEAPKPVVPSAAPNSPVTQAVSETIKDLVQAETPKAVSQPVALTPAPVPPPTGELKTGSGLTAYPGQGKARERFPKEFKTAAEIPAGYAFVPNMGAGTNVIRNDFGQAGYNALVQEQGGPFGADKETREFIKKYNEERIGPPATRELRKKLELPLPENTKGIPMKIAKVGGITGAIMAIPDLANAAENRDVGQAANVASGFLPPAIQALTYAKGAGQGEDAELARQRRMQAYALQAGRGVAQGYDPRRLIGIAPP
jgi:hypothetical protein